MISKASNGAISSRAPARALASETATICVVTRAAARSSATKRACARRDCQGWKPQPWTVWTMIGTPAAAAAKRPRIPALDEFVCTTSGRS